jgi:hypothetical protein
MDALATYIAEHWQPLFGLCIGVALISIYLYLYATKHCLVIPLIARYVFGNAPSSIRSAEGLFNVLTSYVFVIGGIWIVLALFYLTNG